MFVTALAGFLASVLLLKAGLEQMWLRYPLAVLFAWGVFLGLVRLWAELERSTMRMDEEVAQVDPLDDEVSTRKSVWRGRTPEGDPTEWRGWSNLLDFLSQCLEFEGCLIVAAIVAAVAMATGAAIAIGGMILQAKRCSPRSCSMRC